VSGLVAGTMGAVELALGLSGPSETAAKAPARRGTRVLAGLVSLAGLALLLGGERLMVLGSPHGCAYLRATGEPCVGCGGTRAYTQAVRGELVGAMRRHTMGAAAGVAVWLLTLSAALSLLRGRWTGFRATLIVVGLATPVAVVVDLVRWLDASGLRPPA
jgi:hypothetical protein